MTAPVLFGSTALPPSPAPPAGALVEDAGEPAYAIDGVEGMAPFLVSLVSDSDHWLFASSTGGLTAGRRNPRHALFPYVTEDKLADAAGTAGAATAIRAAAPGGPARLWRPQDDASRLAWRIRRRLVKTIAGQRLAFEEENLDLGLAFRQAWETSHAHGFVRTCTLENRSAGPLELHLVDGLVNLLPAEVEEGLQLGFSVLVDAYKRAELLGGGPLAVFALAAQVVDRPEPCEALRATAVFGHGLPGARVHLSAGALRRFALGEDAGPAPREARGQRGAYLLEGRRALAPGERLAWTIVADVQRSQAEVAALLAALGDPEALLARVRADVAAGWERLHGLLAATDAFQATGDAIAAAHHTVNVVFNDLRGGVFADGHAVSGPAFAAFVGARNRGVAARAERFLAELPPRLARAELAARAAAAGDPDLERLCDEYLPLTFSRRHGDPSRPWNRFDVRVRDAAGTPVLHWEGNWRDIFQNWEALSASHPDFLEAFVAKFVNASTPDGHNPYRLSADGLDWEVPDPAHPWSGIGYWGDHQIVYLHRLVERSLAHHPDRLAALLERARFSYADVPYRISPWPRLLEDPRRSIAFDREAHARALARVAGAGADGRLVPGPDGGVLHVTLLEKLLVPTLAKLAAFVPGGGIWMNTQRPEWNDANNALAGFGLSAVTLCQLEPWLERLETLLAPLSARQTPLSAAVARWAVETARAFEAHAPALEAGAPSDEARFRAMEALGEAASRHRAAVYAGGPGAPVPAPVNGLVALLARARRAVRASVVAARREDGLFHAYALLAPRGPGRVGVEHLPEMLEGQVAALGAGALSHGEAVALLDALRGSRLWRADQRSYLLYPDRRLPGFLEKNAVPAEVAARATALARLEREGRGEIVRRDAGGALRFHPDLVEAGRARAALLRLRAAGAGWLDDAAVAEVLEAYEAVFHHRAFTGRSGSMFAYEGLGCSYWHLVAKLALAVQERCFAAADAGAPAEVRERLARHYEAIRAGLGGTLKTVAEWGAFPLDPYSHSPAEGPARQPGMTGQVKEEVLLRLGELGVRIQGGELRFQPLLLSARELLAAPAALRTRTLAGAPLELELAPGTLGFTLCQVPVVYRRGPAPRVEVVWAGGRRELLPGDVLDRARAAAVMGRTGEVERLEVVVTPGRA
jgi:hypothetical protein